MATAVPHGDRPATRRLLGRRALITGAGSGIGAAIARAFVDEGASVGLLGSPHNQSKLGRLAQTLRLRANGAITSAGVDVRDATGLRHAIEDAAAVLGGIDCVVASAGVHSHPDVPPGAWVSDLTREQLQFVLDVNLTGTWLTVRSAIPFLTAASGGSVITMGSVACKRPTHGAYSISKAAVWMLTRALAEELGPQGVRVNCLAPGFVDTPLLRRVAAAESGGDLAAGLRSRAARVPLRRIGTVRDVAHVAVFLASDESSYLTGSLIHPDGGLINANAGG